MAPSLKLTTPGRGAQGEKITVTIEGTHTHFVQGQTIAKFGEGISVGEAEEGEYGLARVLSPGRLVVELAIADDANVDDRSVVVRTGDERLILSDAFSVSSRHRDSSRDAATFTLSPDGGLAGQSITVTIAGDHTHFRQGVTRARFGDGIHVEGQNDDAFGVVSVLSPTQARAHIVIERNAQPGDRTVRVQTGNERLSSGEAFNVEPSPPQFTLVPDSGARGQKTTVLIDAPGAHFEQGETEARFGAGILVGDEDDFGPVTVLSRTQARAELRIRPRARVGPRSVTVRTRREHLFLRHGFHVVDGPPRPVPTITSIAPSAGRQGQTVPVTVVGQNTSFSQPTTQVSLGGGIAANAVTVSNATSLTAELVIAPDAVPGARTLTVTTGAEVATLTNAFTVQAGIPTLTQVQPGMGQQGQTLTVTVTGDFTHFGQETVVDFGTGTIVDAIAVRSATSLSAHVSISRSAIVGARSLTVTSGSEIVSSADALTVARGPSITAVADRGPNAAGWYNTAVTVAFACDDPLSGVTSCPAPKVVSTDGANQVVSGTVVNAAGVTATTSMTVNVDRTPPSVSFTSPVAGSTSFVSDVTATVDVTDALSGVAAAACGGAPAPLNGASVDCIVTLSPGSNTLTATATDAAGNTGTATLPLDYARAPKVTITSPVNLSYLSLSPTTVTGTVDDPAAIVTVNSLPAPVSNGQFSLMLPIAEGPTIIAAVASSARGGNGTATITVTLDTTPPHVSITSPADGFHTTDDAISIAGNVNDIVVGTVNDEQAQVIVNGLPALVGNRTFLRTNVPLAVGDNVIEAVGRDRVGNVANAQIMVTRDPLTQPHIHGVSGNHQTGVIGSPLPSPLVVELVEAGSNPAAGVTVIFKVTQDDGLVSAGAPAATVAVTSDGQGRAQARWTLGHRAGAGSDSVQAYAVGFAGTAIFDATAVQGAAGKIVVDAGNDQVGAVGQPVPKPLIAVVVDDGNNRLGGVPVTFTVLEGGGSFDGQPAVKVNTDPDGRAAATLTLGLQEGNANNVVAATFPDNQSLPAGFTASGRVPGNPANTTISGLVLDNNNVPIPGVTLRAVLTSLLNSNRSVIPSVAAVQTGATGQFTIAQAPVGHVKLLVDGLTAQREGVYPALEYDLVTVAGQDNTVGQPIYLLPLNTANELCVAPTTGGGTLTIPEAPGFSLTINPGQVTFPGGTQTGCVTVTVVHGDKVPMVPGFGQQPRFIVTIQPSGALFNPPATITMPNVDGLKPRAVTEMYSFDHDIGSFVAIGTGTVSDDGLLIRSDPGVGVLKSGWHCGGNPTSVGTAATCPQCQACNGTSCVPSPGGACDDGKFCTQTDTCSNGTCAGTQIPDIPGATSSINVDLDQVMGPVRGFLQSLFGSGAPDLSLSISVSTQDTTHCCDLTQGNVNNVVATGSATVSISTGDIPLPGLAVSLPFNITAGLFASLTLSANGTLTGTNDKCTNTMSGTVGGGIQLTGAIKAQLSLPAGIASASATGSMGVGCSFSGPIQPGSIPCTGTCGNNGIVLDVAATFVNGLFKEETSFVVLPPDTLGTINFFLPSPI